MILRTIIVAFSLIAAYSLGVSCLPENLARHGFGQKDNVVKVENVIYRSTSPKVILVGSSLTALLRDYMLPSDWGNLAIGAGSALTGIEIIKRSQLTPSIVIVEVNMLMRSADTELLEEIYEQPMKAFMDAWPMLRLQNHPTTLLFSFIQRTKGEGINVRTEDKFQLGMAYQRKAFTTALSKPVIKAKHGEFMAELSSLKNLGIKVYLARYPMSPEVAALPQMRGWIGSVKNDFKAPLFDWIDVPADKNFVTTDGLHVDTAGALQMAGILKLSLEK